MLGVGYIEKNLTRGAEPCRASHERPRLNQYVLRTVPRVVADEETRQDESDSLERNDKTGILSCRAVGHGKRELASGLVLALEGGQGPRCAPGLLVAAD